MAAGRRGERRRLDPLEPLRRRVLALEPHGPDELGDLGPWRRGRLTRQPQHAPPRAPQEGRADVDGHGRGRRRRRQEGRASGRSHEDGHHAEDHRLVFGAGFPGASPGGPARARHVRGGPGVRGGLLRPGDPGPGGGRRRARAGAGRPEGLRARPLVHRAGVPRGAARAAGGGRERRGGARRGAARARAGGHHLAARKLRDSEGHRGHDGGAGRLHRGRAPGHGPHGRAPQLRMPHPLPPLRAVPDSSWAHRPGGGDPRRGRPAELALLRAPRRRDHPGARRRRAAPADLRGPPGRRRQCGDGVGRRQAGPQRAQPEREPRRREGPDLLLRGGPRGPGRGAARLPRRRGGARTEPLRHPRGDGPAPAPGRAPAHREGLHRAEPRGVPGDEARPSPARGARRAGARVRTAPRPGGLTRDAATGP
mmetsp:Transcript_1731/g.4886  ORF Transcript_1731/g.4886 Transcript_1731/m.4886 type:complete len:423 (+) Transcript_1731:306-1574(+)